MTQIGRRRVLIHWDESRNSNDVLHCYDLTLLLRRRVDVEKPQ